MTPWAVASQAPPSMRFPRQEYWSGLPFLLPGDLPDPGIDPHLLHLLHWQADSLPLSYQGSLVVISYFIPYYGNKGVGVLPQRLSSDCNEPACNAGAAGDSGLTPG